MRRFYLPTSLRPFAVELLVAIGLIAALQIFGGVFSMTTASAAPLATPPNKAVSIINFSFSPTPLTVPVNTQVVWTNNDTATHTTTSDTAVWDSSSLAFHAQFNFTFTTPGVYTYHCSIHPGMKGTIIVTGVQAIGIYRPSNHTYFLRNTNTTGPADITIPLSSSTDLPIAGDWNGDGIDTIGVFRPSTGQFYLFDSNSTPASLTYSFTLGSPGDLPMAGDWNGDGKAGVGVFRPSNGLIFLKNGLTTGFADFQMVLGSPGDVPIAGDWNGDGKDSPGVYRPSLPMFFVTNQVCNCSVTADASAVLGVSGDTPFAGDWTATGSTGIGVFRPSNGLIYLKNVVSTGFADNSLVFGIPNDLPVAGHWSAQTLIHNTPKIAPTFVP
ncbi:MAG: cupredoxin domain-containing protein [Chloroflexota bacterium]